MASPTRSQQLQRLITRINGLITHGTKTSSLYTKWRFGLFLTGLVCTIAFYKSDWYHAGNLSLAGFAAVFFVVAAYHSRLERRIHRLGLWQSIKRVHLARTELDWSNIPERPPVEATSHLFAGDLDLTGRHSLLHLIDSTVSDQGRERLISWLLIQPPSSAAWDVRRVLCKELASRPLFRDRLVLEARLAGEQEINGKRLAAVLEHPVGFPRLTMIIAMQSVLALTTAVLGVAALLNWLPGYWMFSFALYALIYFQTDQGEELLEHAVGLHHEMERLGTVLAFIERHARRKGSALAAACASLLQPGTRPSQYVRRAARALHAISIKAHPLVHLAVNALCPWDLWFTRQLDQIQRDIRRQLPVWLDRLAEIEAASALATFAYLHPAYIWPVSSQSPGLSASHLGHPLIAPGVRVTNEVQLSGRGTIQLITGSNMSGKSTFLRTIGINLCLAQAGAPVCADRFIWSWSRPACCIRVNDSLDAGLSFFYAEVKRLKAILDETRRENVSPVLFLIDEIFKGTNNRERLIGSRAYIKSLSTGNGFGLVSTHDLELTDLDKEIPSLTNAHFQETVAAGALAFDYRLRPGPCPTTNALRIMALEGLPVPGYGADS
ncbi:putative DNA mismatch repair protein, MutS family [Nitrospira sp. KM1]|uniref:MutS family DNA mismatch repair protein n=1 Tax=Nitrospira sp. KM1 TaxID=1936990 RepID=UPI0013A74DD0|nr:MutS family DNA mismatch repair protein [Nitrospira sp. KM1]BCA56299.1 putative DNA mismatch repair protein, MutS family [Nitrospira sp. KM1]